jgi:hypothetical protein
VRGGSSKELKVGLARNRLDKKIEAFYNKIMILLGDKE